MKNFTLISIFLLAFAGLSMVANATKWIVDKNGHGNFTTIQAAINAAGVGDTVKVWPGNYSEQVLLNKNIVLQGSGYENTLISGSFNPQVNITAGKMMWFSVTSISGTGVQINGTSYITNCVVKYCMDKGIYGSSGAFVTNCVVYNCGGYGIWAYSGNLFVVNCISRNNTSQGFCISGGTMYRSYCNGSTYGTPTGNQGCIDTDPFFVSVADNNFHIPLASPCWNTGIPTLFDPDGSISDMGYFGGPDCPIFPVAYQIFGAPAGNNTDIQAKVRANY